MRTDLERSSTELEFVQKIALTVTTCRCVECHERNDLRGIASERSDYFQTTNPNLGPQGRLPSPLNGAGAKLQSKWLRLMLVSGPPIRPYLMTRMPKFGDEHVAHLVDLLKKADQRLEATTAEPSNLEEPRDDEHASAGSDGLNCIVCHTFQQQPAATMSAIDLT